jgi:disulfide bond formation protein DsbB
MSEQKRYFIVSRYPNDSEPKGIGFSPVGDGKVPEEYLAFRLDVERVVQTINALFEKDKDKRLEAYEQVFQAAQVCFSGREADFVPANQALNELKKTILSSSWIFVRNRIMGVYGLYALLLMIILGAAQCFFHAELKNVPAVLIGTCLGSWLFVSIKTGNIVFDEIYENISQHRSLLLRLIYCCTLSSAVTFCLLAGFFEIKLGEVSTAMIPSNSIIALATGIFFGLGESSLATKLSDKVKDAI